MKSLLSKSVLALAAITCVGVAQATVIDFEEAINSPFAPFAPLFGHGDEFYQGAYWFDPFSNASTAQAGDLVGALVDGSDLANTCWSISCPVNNGTNFYTSLNDGVIAMGSTIAGRAFKLGGFDASFIAAADATLSAVSGLLRLQGNKADGSSLTQTYQLAGPDQAGDLNFDSFQTSGAFATSDFVSMFFYSFACNSAGVCNAFSSNSAQFAIDNISLNDINLNNLPEPAGLALAILGLAGIGATRRRRA